MVSTGSTTATSGAPRTSTTDATALPDHHEQQSLDVQLTTIATGLSNSVSRRETCASQAPEDGKTTDAV